MFKLTKIVKMKLYDRLDLTCIPVSKKLQNWVYKFKDVFSFPLKEYSTAFFPTYEFKRLKIQGTVWRK